MTGVEWIIAIGEHMAAGIAAKALEAFGLVRRPQPAARNFNSRISVLNSSMQQILGKVLLAAYPELAGRVLTVNVGAGRRSYPVVDLIGADSAGQPAVTISPSISGEHDNMHHNESFIELMKSRGRDLWDSDVFRLVGISEKRELIFGITRYYKALTTCDRFLFELVEHLPRRPTDFRCAVLARRSFMRKWRRDVESIITDGQFHHLSAAVGVSVFTVIKRPSKTHKGDYWYPCIENSRTKNGARDRHVIPSFMYEPVTSSPQERTRELDLEYQVLREFGEEVAGIPELKSMMHLEAVNAIIQRDPACSALFSLLRNGHATLTTTGLWLDLLRLRPEITCALVIKDEGFYRDHVEEFRGSWENNPGVRWSRLTSESDYESLLSDTEFPLCPPAVASIVSGRRFALKQLNLGRRAHGRS